MHKRRGRPERSPSSGRQQARRRTGRLAHGCEPVPGLAKTRPLVVTGHPCASRMIPLESPVLEIGTPGSESGGRKRAHGSRPAARLRKHRISHRPPTGNAPPLDSTTTSPTGVTPQARDSWARARERGNVVSVTVLSVRASRYPALRQSDKHRRTASRSGPGALRAQGTSTGAGRRQRQRPVGPAACPYQDDRTVTRGPWTLAERSGNRPRRLHRM